MSHLPPSQAAIFSPSVARAAASTAKDWSYIDTWLRSKYATNPSINRGRPPTFERNPETLRALLALAAANEAADEEREQLFHVEEAALTSIREKEQLQQQQQQEKTKEGKQQEIPSGHHLSTTLLTALESALTKEAQTALTAMSNTSVSLNTVTSPTPTHLAAKYTALQSRAAELTDAAARVDLLQKYVAREEAALDAFLSELQHGEKYAQAPDLAKQNLELQRRIKGAAAKLPELRRQAVVLEKATGGVPGVTVEEVRGEEEGYLAVLAVKRELDARVRAFAGLPPDVEAARAELEALRVELRDATERRDANFEMLVERESPVKSRRRP